MRPSLWLLTAMALGLVLGCRGDAITGPVAPSLSIVPGGGDNQSGTAGTTLPLPLIVQVTGVTGSPNGQILNFVVTSGGGSVFANVVLTATPNSGPANKMSGIGQNIWTLGPAAGPQTVEARLIDPKTGATLTEATFHATAVAGAATVLELSAGDKQSAVAGSAVSFAPAVLVTDQTGNPIANVTVTFAVASGGGSITGPTQITTGPSGVAAVGGWILGATAGANTLTATASGLGGSPLTFSATGLVGPSTQLVPVQGDGQRAEMGSTLPLNPKIEVRDLNGNGVAGVAVTFTVTAGGGTMDGITSVTTLSDQDGAASVAWTLGWVNGPNALRATTLGLSGSPVTFSATGYAPVHIANQNSHSITVYDPESSGNATPVRTIAGPSTGLNTPASMTRDAVGQLYVTNYTGQSLTIYATGASGNAVPARTIAGVNTGLSRPFALTRDAGGQIYVFDYASRTISVFAADATGNVAPLRVISGPNTGLNGVPGLKVSLAGELYVADQDAGNVKVFAAAASGNVAPLRTISGPGTGLNQPGDVELDATGLLYVTNFRGASVTVYAPDAAGDATPVRTITGANTNLAFPTGLSFDSTGQIYVSNYIGQSITVYAPGATGNATPLRLIAGPGTGLNFPGAITF